MSDKSLFSHRMFVAALSRDAHSSSKSPRVARLIDAETGRTSADPRRREPYSGRPLPVEGAEEFLTSAISAGL